jgi:hypothetical protein
MLGPPPLCFAQSIQKIGDKSGPRFADDAKVLIFEVLLPQSIQCVRLIRSG